MVALTNVTFRSNDHHFDSHSLESNSLPLPDLFLISLAVLFSRSVVSCGPLILLDQKSLTFQYLAGPAREPERLPISLFRHMCPTAKWSHDLIWFEKTACRSVAGLRSPDSGARGARKGARTAGRKFTTPLLGPAG